MFTAVDRKITGASALLAGALSLVMIPLYFIYSGPPPAGNVLVRNLMTVVIMTLFLVFAAGARRILGPRAGLAGDLVAVAGVVYAAMTLVAASLETGVALQFPDGSKDPTVDGPLANGMALLHGPIARVLIAVFLVALASGARVSGALPAWTRTGSVLLAVVNVVFIPSLFFGMDPSNFYAANGWGSTASIGAVLMLWTGILGLVILRAQTRYADAAEDLLTAVRQHEKGATR
jgi:type IV secretory pathway VirB2 component (pilin)